MNAFKVIAAVSVVLVSNLAAQSPQQEDHQSTGDPNAAQSAGLELGHQQEFVWLLGLRITATGGASGITASAPLPVNWPEQTVEIISEEKSEGVGRIAIKRLTKNARQMVFKIRKMRSGEVAQAILKLKVTKRHITGTENSEQLRFAKKIPPDVKQYLRPSPYIESSHKKIKELAGSIPLAEEKCDYEKAEQIYSWVRQNIEYQFDETISHLSRSDRCRPRRLRRIVIVVYCHLPCERDPCPSRVDSQSHLSRVFHGRPTRKWTLDSLPNCRRLSVRSYDRGSPHPAKG